jgi:phenylpropionate dioxygenase-like ring-hydroxylating dioxygenase large terminal subunit
MLNREDNELLTRIGPGTPMGELMRRYWQPALISSELPERDGPPVRLRLLGEELIAFRDTNGRVGILGANCPHRGAPLYFARNEDGGIRCIYHGWKFDVEGRCLDIPNAAAGDRDIKAKVRAKNYRCVERNGIIWAYLGAGEPPAMPELGWSELPVEHKIVTKQLLECNYAQALEGDLDPSHVSFLHAPLDPRGQSGYQGTAGILSERHLSDVALEQEVKAADKSPQINVLKTDYGLFVGARRDAGADRNYWRFTQFVLPFYVYVPGAVGSPVHCNVWQPMDDERTMVWRIQYLHERPFAADERARLTTGTGAHIPPEGYMPATPEPGGAWMPKANRTNNYLQDRAHQRTISFSGIKGIWAQDRACTEGMGQIMDRTQEHLVSSDATIVQMRRMLLSAVKNGEPPPGVNTVPPIMREPTVFHPKSRSWDDLSRDYAHGKTPATA